MSAAGRMRSRPCGGTTATPGNESLHFGSFSCVCGRDVGNCFRKGQSFPRLVDRFLAGFFSFERNDAAWASFAHSCSSPGRSRTSSGTCQ